MQNWAQSETVLKAIMLEAQVLAALGGHELDSWKAVGESGKLEYQAVCRNCGRSIYVNSKVFYSIFDLTHLANKRTHPNLVSHWNTLASNDHSIFVFPSKTARLRGAKKED